MAEYLIQDTTLKNIGDKIRTLTGSTDTMSPDDMATNLDSAQADVLNALSAIEGKGVTVPDGTLLDGMAELIEGIEAGGRDVIVGTVTFAGSYSNYKLLTYDELVSVFGEPLPTLLVLFYGNTSQSGTFTDLILWKSDESEARYCYKSIASGTNVGSSSRLSDTIPTLDSTALTINKYSSYSIFGEEFRYCISRFEL